jgi:formylglycine-generating enzyme
VRFHVVGIVANARHGMPCRTGVCRGKPLRTTLTPGDPNFTEPHPACPGALWALRMGCITGLGPGMMRSQLLEILAALLTACRSSESSPDSQPSCPSGLTECGAGCISVLTDPSNCGGCGLRCPSDQSCGAGVCRCASGQVACDGGCVEPSDPGACSACGLRCGDDEKCCATRCVNVTADDTHCGYCDSPCPAGYRCVGGDCREICDDGMAFCAGKCVDLMLDNSNCGACGHGCPAMDCCGGACGGKVTLPCNCGPLEECRDGARCVSASVPVTAGGAAYAIDATETTNEQYAAWLASCPSTKGQHPLCARNLTFVPEVWPAKSQEARNPVAHVDWCDAAAFCAAAGKRLCGSIGSVEPVQDGNNPAQSQWYNACSTGGANDYPYGDTYIPGACNDHTGGVAAVARYSACLTSDGVYDLDGNLQEWEDSCLPDMHGIGCPDWWCNVRGGSFESYSTMGCGGFDYGCIDEGYAGVGFRCCTP